MLLALAALFGGRRTGASAPIGGNEEQLDGKGRRTWDGAGAYFMIHDEDLPGPGKRLALFFDGTWNIPESNTSVWRFYLMLADRGGDNLAQESFYDEGVGTHWLDRLSGGLFGAGLSQNVRSGYRWLMEHYNHGDEIFIFGFSRGAFTARSLAGLIARCGLLKPDAPL